MIIGIFANALTFLSFIICLLSYYRYHKKNHRPSLVVARTAYYSSSFLILIQAAMLMWGIHTHQFHWQYVYQYSSIDLNALYLTSTFWAGQEGKKNKHTEQQAVRQPTPYEWMVKYIPGSDVNGRDDHDHKNQIAGNPAGPVYHFVNPAKKFIDDLAHCSCLSPIFRIPWTEDRNFLKWN